MSLIRNEGRVAGFWYLMVIVFGIFAEVVRSSLVIPGQPLLTAENLQSSNLLFRVGFVSDLVMMVSFLFLGFAFFQLLHRFDRPLASSIVVFMVLGIAINMTGLGSYYSILNWLNGADAAQGQLQALASLKAYRNTYDIANLFFGLWLMPTGILLFRSKLVPKAIAALACTASVFFITDSLVKFLFPDAAAVYTIVAAVPTVLGEFGICFWLLIAGSRTPAASDSAS